MPVSVVSAFQSVGKRTTVNAGGRQSSTSKFAGVFPFVTTTVAVISLSCKTRATWLFDAFPGSECGAMP